MYLPDLRTEPLCSESLHPVNTWEPKTHGQFPVYQKDAENICKEEKKQ